MAKKTKRNVNMLLPGLEDFDPAMMVNFENDPSLESELMAILGGGSVSPEKRKPKPPNRPTKAADIDKNLFNLDINEDEDVGEVDEDDPELLAELNGMLDDDANTPIEETMTVSKPPQSSENVRTLENLESLYKVAIEDARTSNDGGKMRRYERSLKTIEDLLKKARRGENVNEADFPLPVTVKVAQKIAPPPVKVEDVRQTTTVTKNTPALAPAPAPAPRQSPAPKNAVLDALLQRQIEYKQAAVKARQNDLPLAKGLLVVVHGFEEVIAAVRGGQPFDLADMPPPPAQFRLSDLEGAAEEPEDPSPPEEAPPVTRGLREELLARQAFYRESLQRATAESNPGKERRLARVLQQYGEALHAFDKKQTSYAYEELLPPPGKAPLSRPGQTGPSLAKPAAPSVGHPPSGPAPVSKTLQALLQRQSQFRVAALKAKTEGDLPLAKELLRQSKGIEQMVRASEGGLPVDLSKLPTLPTEPDNDYELISAEMCETPDDLRVFSGDRRALFGRLRAVLGEQARLCKEYQAEVLKAGDVLGAKRFESMALSCQKDIDGLSLLAAQPNAPLPQFHYEYKILAVRRANADLGETEMSVEVLRAVDLALPQGFTAEQLDTYVVLELPFPNEAPQTFTTETVRRTNCPEYAATTKFEVNLKSRVFQRVVRSKTLKAEIFYRRGFLQKYKLLGSCALKMDRLESACTVHDCHDILEGRKVIGGKLEVRMRLRSSLGGPQTEQVKEKWLVIDQFNQNSERAAFVDRLADAGVAADLGSVEVLKFEINGLRQRLVEAGATVPASLAASVRQKVREKEDAVRRQQERAQSTDAAVRATYLQYVTRLPGQYAAEAKKQLAAGNRDKAQACMTKKKIVEAEVERLKTKK